MSEQQRPTLEELRAALDSDVETLLISMGAFGGDVSPRDALDKGMRIFEQLYADVRARVCGGERLRAVVEDNSDPLIVCGAIADLILGETGHVQPATLAALLVKHGVPRYCFGLWR